MALSLSTSWFRIKEYTPEKLVKKLIELEIEAIELQYRIPSDFWKKLKPLLKREGIKISSIHNFFPVPEILEKGSGDAFLLTSLDESERNLAIKFGSRSIKIASEVGAPAVIFHTGHVPVSEQKLNLFFKYFDGGNKKNAKLLLYELMKEREAQAKIYFDRLLISLEDLIIVAEKEGVRLGIENRYYPNEIPLPEEMDEILKKFQGAPIGYWHDVGHAHHLNIIGVLPQENWLEKFNDFLLGVHLHDAKGREDHLAPCTGEINFNSLTEQLKENSIKVIEVHPKVEKEDLKESIKFLNKNFKDNSKNS